MLFSFPLACQHYYSNSKFTWELRFNNSAHPTLLAQRVLRLTISMASLRTNRLIFFHTGNHEWTAEQPIILRESRLVLFHICLFAKRTSENIGNDKWNSTALALHNCIFSVVTLHKITFCSNTNTWIHRYEIRGSEYDNSEKVISFSPNLCPV